MNYEKKAKERLDKINSVFGDQISEMKSGFEHYLEMIRKMPNGPDKEYHNKLYNRMNSILSEGGSPEELKEIIEELKNKSLNLA